MKAYDARQTTKGHMFENNQHENAINSLDILLSAESSCLLKLIWFKLWMSFGRIMPARHTQGLIIDTIMYELKWLTASVFYNGIVR